MFRWLVTAGARLSFSSLARYPLTSGSTAALLLFAVLFAVTLFLLIKSSYEKERAGRKELYERDLRELVGRFDVDERYVLANNFEEFFAERRALAPLLLPRAYYFGLPSRASLGPPRLPPRNCFVDLVPASGIVASRTTQPDRFCAYVVPDAAYGTHVFFAFSFMDDDLVIHRIGDARLAADSLKLAVRHEDKVTTWILSLQEPTAYLIPAKYALTAYLSDGKTLVRDKRFEGWAHTQRQEGSNTSLVTILARLDYRALEPNLSKSAATGIWPPRSVKDIRFRLARRDVSKRNLRADFIPYEDTGISLLSLPSLYQTLETTHASLMVRSVSERRAEWRMTPEGAMNNAARAGAWMHLRGDGDLVFSSSEPMTRSSLIPDTDLVVELIHPGTVIEKAIWQTVLFLGLLLGTFLGLALFFIFMVLRPIRRMARDSIAISKLPADSGKNLRYSDQNNEIGDLSRAFNTLLSRTREQAKREVEERIKREELKRRREIEEVKAREVNLKVIGHEIRAPLQALLGLNPLGTESRRYVERMVRAVTQLFGATGPEAGLAGMQVTLEKQNLDEFLQGLAANAPRAGIPDVRYFGHSGAITCMIDDNALEDAITHILDNANRLRTSGTAIDISLAPENTDALIMITNQGPNIPQDMLETIFEYGASLDGRVEEGRMGQGLFVARSHIRKMGGDVTAHNLSSGVVFEIRLPTTS
jgi:signal transduction histidine kinase